MSLRNARTTALTVLTIGLTAFGCGREQVVELPDGVLTLGEFQETKVERRSVVLGDRSLTIEGENGSVSLSGGGPGQVDLTFNVQARGDTRDKARAQLDAVLIEEVGDETSYTYDIRPDRNDVTNVDVTGTVPSGAEIRLILRSGNVTLTNLNGEIDVLLENGSISYLGGSGSIALTTRNGNVSADFYDHGVGDVAALSTTNGSVTLGLSDRANTQVHANTRSGEARVSGITFVDPRLDRRGASTRFSAEVGAGGGSINMKTQNGNLIFKRHALVPPPSPAPAVEDAPVPRDSTSVATPPHPVPAADTTAADVDTSAAPTDSLDAL